MMKMNDIMNEIAGLARSQGYYGRLYERINEIKETEPEAYEELVATLEEEGFETTLDLVLYFEEGKHCKKEAYAMKLDKETYEYYLCKQAFIRQVGEALALYARSSVAKVDLEFYENKESGAIQEYLVVTFDGGAISVRSANINSDTANFRELGNLIDGGYYSEVKDYREMVASKDWERIA